MMSPKGVGFMAKRLAQNTTTSLAKYGIPSSDLICGYLWLVLACLCAYTGFSGRYSYFHYRWCSVCQQLSLQATGEGFEGKESTEYETHDVTDFKPDEARCPTASMIANDSFSSQALPLGWKPMTRLTRSSVAWTTASLFLNIPQVYFTCPMDTMMSKATPPSFIRRFTVNLRCCCWLRSRLT